MVDSQDHLHKFTLFFAVTQLLLISPIFLIVWSELLKVKCKYGCKLFYVGFVLVNSVAELLHNV